ncbi:hypothetical protein PT276_06335 [Orbaceae bacterium ESL0721]|nr:hypothetical protein [Orbaceae bacterium ESL0721]
MSALKFSLLWLLFTVTFFISLVIIGNLVDNLVDNYLPHRFGIDIPMIIFCFLSALAANLLIIYLSFAVTKWLKNRRKERI